MDLSPQLTTSELELKIAQLKKDCEELDQENELLDGYYSRVKGEKLEINPMSEEEVFQAITELISPSNVQPSGNPTPDVEKILMNSESNEVSSTYTKNSRKNPGSQSSRRSHRSKTNSLSSSLGAGNTHIMAKLKVDVKCDIAQREIDQIEKELGSCKTQAELVVDRLESEIENLKLGDADNLKGKSDFERDMKGSLSKQSGKYQTEKFERHIVEKTRFKESFVKKLRLKTGAMSVQSRKVSLQIKQKDDMGEVVTGVDFEQLKIENQQYLEKIDVKNTDLLSLKAKSSNTALKLGSKKEELNKIVALNTSTKREIEAKESMRERCKLESSRVLIDIEEAKSALSDIKQKVEDFRVPETKEYIQGKLKLEEIRHKAGIWLRKVEIAELKLRSVSGRWRSVCKKQDGFEADFGNLTPNSQKYA